MEGERYYIHVPRKEVPTLDFLKSSINSGRESSD